MVEIDWVEIPGGEFVYGLSAAQAEDLLSRMPGQLDAFHHVCDGHLGN